MTSVFAMSVYYVLQQHRALFDTVVLYSQQKQEEIAQQTKHTLLTEWYYAHIKELQKISDGEYQLAKNVEVVVKDDIVSVVVKI